VWFLWRVTSKIPTRTANSPSTAAEVLGSRRTLRRFAQKHAVVDVKGIAALLAFFYTASMRRNQLLRQMLSLWKLIAFFAVIHASDAQQSHDTRTAVSTRPVCTATGNAIPQGVPLAQSTPIVYEVHYCVDLGITYIHIYKNAGTTILTRLRRFCSATTGNDPIMYTNWGGGLYLASLSDVCSVSLCFTFWREPVDRFLSGYHEVMRENHLINLRFRDLLLWENATPAQKIANIAKFLSKLERGVLHDGHVARQQDFVVEDNRTAIPGLTVFPLFAAVNIIPTIFCGALARCAPAAMCPTELAEFRGDRPRARMSAEYGLKQYVLQEAELPTELVHWIVNFYRADYCRFGIPPHPRGPPRIACP
jgi:hypothetical protein